MSLTVLQELVHMIGHAMADQHQRQTDCLAALLRIQEAGARGAGGAAAMNAAIAAYQHAAEWQFPPEVLTLAGKAL